MEEKLSKTKLIDEDCEKGTNSSDTEIIVATNPPPPTPNQMLKTNVCGQMVELLKSASRDNKKLVLPTPGCDMSSGGNSPTSVSSTSSNEKSDSHGFDFASYTEPDMQREDERIKTFEKWPVPFISPETLAKNGFYYLGRGDEVRCAFCKVEIMRWMEGDDPAQDHQRWAPQCPFLRRQAGVAPAPAPEPPAAPRGRDECGVRVPPNPSVRMPGPVHKQYAAESARLRSYKDWPRSLRQKPEDLAAAGFFYTGQSDKTKCFYCDGGLKDWEDDDVPWEQHARWFDRCAFVQLVKGKDYVQKVVSEAAAVRAPEVPAEAAPAPVVAAAPAEPAAAAPEEAVDDTKLCRICYVEERNVVFVPCGHVVACAKCALSTDRCPMCRRTFQNAVRLYFS